VKTERRIQQEIFTYHWNTRPLERGLLLYLHNNSKDAVSGNINRSMGVVPGASDLVYLNPTGQPIFMEVKTPTGRQSASQKKFENTITRHGYEYHIVRSLEEAKEACGWT
jgi:hypothetical protein